jgi:hypothetical protein
MMTQPSQPSARWALLIGIDRYSRLGETAQLSGCENDVEVIGQILIDRFAFPADHVVKLVNEAATRTAILGAMDALVATVVRGDVVVLHYSGHGSQARSLDPAEADGLDETILPHDTGRSGDAPNLDIRDKEIHAWLERITAVTGNVTLIFDSCHSGGVTRDATGAKARWVKPDLRPPDHHALLAPTRSASRSRNEIGPSGWVPLGQRYVLLAGCSSSECSYELAAPGGDGLHHGALTYFLSRQLVNAGQGSTYRDVFEAAVVQVAGNCSLQHPQLEGECDRVLFGLDRIEPMRFVLVRERSGEQVVLGSGLAAGLSRGSTWAIYPAGTKQVTQGDAPLGTIEITAARSVTSTGKVIGEATSGAVAAGARAVELSHDFGDLSIGVRIVTPGTNDPSAQALAEAIAESRVLKPACGSEPAGATAYLLAPREQASESDPVPQLGLLDEPVWAVVGQGGELILPLCRPGFEASRLLRDNLETRARSLAALAIQNPGSRLLDTIDCVLLRQSEGGDWIPATAAPGGLPLFTAGERLAFEITNRSSLPLYCYVLDFGLTGCIGPVYPIAGVDEPLRAGGSIRVGTRSEEAMDLMVPPEFPFLPPASPADEVGKETLKVIATTRPTDFYVLFQEGYRAGEPARGSMSSLDRLLGITAGGPTREIRIQGRPGEEDWTTVERSFWLQPQRR